MLRRFFCRLNGGEEKKKEKSVCKPHKIKYRHSREKMTAIGGLKWNCSPVGGGGGGGDHVLFSSCMS